MKNPYLMTGIGMLLAGVCTLAGCQPSSDIQETSLHTPIETPSVSQEPAGETVQQIPAIQIVQATVPESVRWTEEERRQAWLSDTFTEAVGDFGYESATKILQNTEENGLYSPLSLYFALSMASAGAEGDTRQELLKVLHYPDQSSLDQDCSDAMKIFYQDDELFRFQIASSLWASDQVTWKQPFLDTMEEQYYADVYRADFSDPNLGSEMGQWVKEKTNGLIEPTIPASLQTVMTLMNTIYYYDQWRDQFDVEQTAEGIFTTDDGREVTCEYMNRTMGSHGYHRGEDYTVSSLHTKNGSVQFLLPDQGVDLKKFLEDPETLETALTGESVSGQVIWQVPKFSYGTSYGLKDALKALGVESAFSPDKADFGNMSDSASWIDSVIQQNHIGIDENGIEAASFTMIVWAGAARPQGRAEMILDRPFLYVVRHKSCPVFIGICGDPTKK